MEPELDKWIGATVGRYVVEGVLGSGGMGAVYRAADPHGRLVALKILREELKTDWQHISRFFREAEAAARLEHPNIVRVLEQGGSPPEAPWIALELLSGQSVGEILRDEGAPEIRRAVRWGRELFSALAAAHAAGIVHRDVKPANVFIADVGRPTETVKLLDFGIVKMTESPGFQRLTRTGQVVGTPRYMAPEQASGGLVDARADIYSAAAVLYATLSGRRPFSGQGLAELIPQILNGDLVPLRELRPEIDPELAAVVHRAMAVEPANRQASASVVVAALEPFEAGERSVHPPTVLGDRQATVAQGMRLSKRVPATVVDEVAPEMEAVAAPWHHGQGQPEAVSSTLPAGSMPEPHPRASRSPQDLVRGTLSERPLAPATRTSVPQPAPAQPATRASAPPHGAAPTQPATRASAPPHGAAPAQPATRASAPPHGAAPAPTRASPIRESAPPTRVSAPQPMPVMPERPVVAPVPRPSGAPPPRRPKRLLFWVVTGLVALGIGAGGVVAALTWLGPTSSPTPIGPAATDPTPAPVAPATVFVDEEKDAGAPADAGPPKQEEDRPRRRRRPTMSSDPLPAATEGSTEPDTTEPPPPPPPEPEPPPASEERRVCFLRCSQSNHRCLFPPGEPPSMRSIECHRELFDCQRTCPP